LDSHPVCALAAGHVLAMVVKGAEPMARSLPARLLGWLSHRAVEVAHRTWVCLAQTVTVRSLPEVLQELAVRPVLSCLAQTVTAKHLLEVRSHPAQAVRLSLADRAKQLPDCEPHPLDLRQQPMGCLLVVRLRESAVECSWDFDF
jgi:hypothetical protein